MRIRTPVSIGAVELTVPELHQWRGRCYPNPTKIALVELDNSYEIVYL